MHTTQLPNSIPYSYVLALSLSLSLSLSISLSPPFLSIYIYIFKLFTYMQSCLDQWCIPLLQSCEQYISSVLQVDKAPNKEGEAGSRSATHPTPIINEDEAIQYLFTLGEVAQVKHKWHNLDRSDSVSV